MTQLQITEVNITPFEGDERFLGYASVTFNDCLVVRGLRICKGRYGLFVSWPKTKDKNGEYHPTTFPVTRSLWDYVQQTVLRVHKNGAL